MASPLDSLAALSKVQQALIIAGIGLVSALVLYWMASKDLTELGEPPEDFVTSLPEFLIVKEGGGLWGTYRQVETEIVNYNTKIAQKDSKEQELSILQREIEIAKRRLPEEKAKGKMRALLDGYASKVDPGFGVIDLQSTQISSRKSGGSRRGKAAKEEYYSVEYKVNLVGTLSALIAYINAIEKSEDRFMVVERVTVAPGNVGFDVETNAPTYGLHSISMSIITYVYQGDA